MLEFFSDNLFKKLKEETEHSEKDGLHAALNTLKEAHIFAACLPKSYGGKDLSLWHEQSCKNLFWLLRRFGYINLSLARIFEGHCNAVRLLFLYGTPSLQETIFAQIRNGAILGVWGADVPQNPVRYISSSEKGGHLVGQKCFASGLGLVNYAVITVRKQKEDNPETEETFLVLVDATEEKRQDLHSWDTASGMCASASGTYDFTGVTVERGAFMGPAGAFYKEPHFEGGIWRYCVAHLGACNALIDMWQRMVHEAQRSQDPLQRERLGQARTLNLANAAMLEKAMETIERCARSGPSDMPIEMAVAGCLLARQFTEECCVKIMNLCEKSLGMRAFFKNTPIEVMRRDLSFFIRQAVPDSKLQRAASTLETVGEATLW